MGFRSSPSLPKTFKHIVKAKVWSFWHVDSSKQHIHGHGGTLHKIFLVSYNFPSTRNLPSLRNQASAAHKVFLSNSRGVSS